MGRTRKKPSERIFYLGEWLDRLGVKQVALAKEIGVSETYISELVSRRKAQPTPDVLLDISEFLKISVNLLFKPPPPRVSVEAAQSLRPDQIGALGDLLDEISRRKGK